MVSEEAYELEPPFTRFWWVCVGVATGKKFIINLIVCTLLAGLFSGLNIGVLSVPERDLELKKVDGTPEEKR